MGKVASINFQDTRTRDEDKSSPTARYKIVYYGADFTLELLSNKLINNEIVIPSFQRRFVWSLKRSSRLIESFLLGLPVPQIFLYREEKKQDLLVVDGHQRLKSIKHFFSGVFEDGSMFRLRGVKDQWEGKTYGDLKETERRFLKNSVLRATIFEQTDPKDNTSMFEIFNRLNTGGMPLSSQEIRNCIFGGEFNEFIIRLNRYPRWRDLMGTSSFDKRMRDVEMILRFFALKDRSESYSKSMRDFLSNYMHDNRHMSEGKRRDYETLFKQVVNKVHRDIGPRAFIVIRGVNAAILDSIMVSLARLGVDNVTNLRHKYEELLANSAYREYVSKWTTDTERVTGRIKIANGIFS